MLTQKEKHIIVHLKTSPRQKQNDAFNFKHATRGKEDKLQQKQEFTQNHAILASDGCFTSYRNPKKSARRIDLKLKTLFDLSAQRAIDQDLGRALQRNC